MNVETGLTKSGGNSDAATPIIAADDSAIDRAAIALMRGGVLAIPTATVYGLVCRADNPAATSMLSVLKGRPDDMNLQVLVSNMDAARTLVDEFDESAEKLARRWWPGGITLVLRRAAGIDWDLGASSTTIGIRCPPHPVPSALCDAVGPLCATSANLHGEPPLETAEGIAAAFPKGLELILDGGPCGAVPSTVVDLSGEAPQCLREGAVAWSEILAELTR